MVRDNPAIRSLLNLPRFFTDSVTTSANPADYVYQPVVTTTLAIDYLLGRGPSPLFLHLDSFLLFLATLATMAWLLHSIFERAIPHPWNPYLALMAAALVGLHPASAELLNPINHRSELIAALGVVSGMAVYAGLPEKRRYFYYLIPPLLAVLAHPAGLIFGPILLLYMILIEPPRSSEDEQPLTDEQVRTSDESQALAVATASGESSGPKRIRIRRRKHPFWRYVRTQFVRFMPALLFTAGALAFHVRMTPFETAGDTVIRYWFTEPWVALRYFRSFFAPYYFSPSSDLAAFPGYDTRGLFGLAFVLAILSIALVFSISRSWRPAVFGLWWFVLGLMPGALIAQPDLEADTRMFLPFIGLAMTFAWTAKMVLPSGEPLRRLEAIAAGVLMIYLGYQTHERNRIWKTDDSLWHEAVAKSPASVHALRNYGLALAAEGRNKEAYEMLRAARQLTPKAAELEAHLGTVAAALGRSEEAEQHFNRGLALGAGLSVVHFEYGKFQEKMAARTDAIESYNWAASLALSDLRPRYALMRLYQQSEEWNNLRLALEEAQPIWRGDPALMHFTEVLRDHPDNVKGAELLARQNPTAENHLKLSEQYCLAGEFQKCLDTAKKAIELRPNYSRAYNAMGAAYKSMGQVDEGIEAVKHALQIDPDDKIAQTNFETWTAEKFLAGNEIMRK
jgi:tetratricopeptide (TPR) repeat protein